MMTGRPGVQKYNSRYFANDSNLGPATQMSPSTGVTTGQSHQQHVGAEGNIITDFWSNALLFLLYFHIGQVTVYN